MLRIANSLEEAKDHFLSDCHHETLHCFRGDTSINLRDYPTAKAFYRTWWVSFKRPCEHFGRTFGRDSWAMVQADDAHEVDRLLIMEYGISSFNYDQILDQCPTYEMIRCIDLDGAQNDWVENARLDPHRDHVEKAIDLESFDDILPGDTKSESDEQE